jgi:hypothetical protein
MAGASRLTILDAEDKVSEPQAARLLRVSVGGLAETNLHDNTLFAHFHDHVQAVVLGVVQDLE